MTRRRARRIAPVRINPRWETDFSPGIHLSMPGPASCPTIADVAAMAGVSKKTVSFVLNGRPGTAPATRARVRAAADALGFAPNPQARALAGGVSPLVALLHAGDDADALAPAITGASRALDGSGCLLVVRDLSADPGDLAAWLGRHRPRGAILLPALAAAAPGTAGLPLLAPSAWRAALGDAIGYLRALGHARLALIVAESDPPPIDREDPFEWIAADHGALALSARAATGTEPARMAAALLLELSPRPTAVLATCPLLAAGVLQAARQAGLRVPQDLSVLSLGDAPWAERLDPPLTAMRFPLAELAESLAGQLAEPGRTAPDRALPALLHARGSTGPAGAAASHQGSLT